VSINGKNKTLYNNNFTGWTPFLSFNQNHQTIYGWQHSFREIKDPKHQFHYLLPPVSVP